MEGLEARTLFSRALGIDVSSYQTTIDWNQVKASGRTFAWTKSTEGVTFNDACLAVTGGALRRLALDRGELPPRLKVAVPVSMRGRDPRGWGNRISFTAIELPLDEPSAPARNRKPRTNMLSPFTSRSPVPGARNSRSGSGIGTGHGGGERRC